MAYRLAMMTFASTTLLSLWTLTRRLGGVRAARLAVLLAATTPFLVHEVWFTWPKLLATSLVLLAALSLIEGRALDAGFLVGIGYLVHPLALVSLPALGLIAVWPLVGAQLRRPQLRSGLWLLGGAAVPVAAWRVVNGSHYVQSDFLHYITGAGRAKAFGDLLVRAFGGHPTPVTLSDWISDRLVSLGNTLVPTRLFFFSGHDPSINVVRPCYPFCAGRSPAVVHFFFQYWNTLPFGIGIVFFPLLLASLWRAARRWTWPILVAVIVPFVVFAVYWGDASTGLLREGLHAWVLTLLIVVALEQCGRGYPWLRAWPSRAVLALRSVEVLLVATVPTIATRHRLYDDRFVLTDIAALLTLVGLCGWVAVRCWRERPP
jgi:4-amino-4-deoxy-L-arabinose transferase-like glycosyltransferase